MGPAGCAKSPLLWLSRRPETAWLAALGPRAVPAIPFLVRMLKNLMELVTPWLRDKDFLKLPPEERAREMIVEHEIHRELGQAVIRGDVAGAQEWIRRHAEHEVSIFGRDG